MDDQKKTKKQRNKVFGLLLLITTFYFFSLRLLFCDTLETIAVKKKTTMTKTALGASLRFKKRLHQFKNEMSR